MTASTAPARIDHHEAMRQISEQEQRLRLAHFDGGTARRLGEELIAAAPAPVAVRVRVGSRLLYGACSDAAVPNSEIAAELKLNVVARWGRSSLWLHHWLGSTDRAVTDLPWLDPRQLMALGGGFPLVVGGLLVGGIAISGLPHRDDHDLVATVLDGELRRQHTS